MSHKEKYAFRMPQVQVQPALPAEPQICPEAVSDLGYVPLTGTYQGCKRVLDVAAAVLALSVLALPMALVALTIVIDDPGNPFFRQYRVGRDGKRFWMYKFRTMKRSAPRYLPAGQGVDPEQYVTRLGRFLRRSSLDELPQLWNVLRGDMSIVGPRPLIPEESEIHSLRLKLGVYALRPGITGLAQINGREKLSAADKVRWDVKYLEGFSFRTDMKILFSTAAVLFTGDDSTKE
jgi:O-antigen biosynthesis protein WbqP